MKRRPRHRPGFHPAIQHVRNPFPPVFGKRVKGRPVKVVKFRSEKFFDFRDRSEHLVSTVLFPNRKRRSPKPVARNRPRPRVRNPVREPSPGACPPNAGIVFDKFVSDFRNVDIPRIRRAINQLFLRPLAVRIRVFILLFFNQKAGFFKKFYDFRIGLENVHFRKVRNLRRKVAIIVDIHDNREFRVDFLDRPKVLFPECGRDMDNAGPVRVGYEIRGNHDV